MVATILSGCITVGHPSLPASTVVVPPMWSNAAVSALSTPQQLEQWWRQFNDPALDELIAMTMTSAPDIRTAQAKLRQARASRDLEVAGLFPNLGVSASATRSRSGIEAGGSGKAQTLYAAGFDASWEPSIFGGQRDTAAGATADLAASEASLAAIHVSLVAEVALEYIALRATQQQLAITRDNIASQAETLQITEWRQQAGLTTVLSVEQARTTLEQSRALIPGIEVNRAAAVHRLAILAGRTPGAFAVKLDALKPLPAVPDGIALGIPADTLRQRYDIRAAELKVRAEMARSDAQHADRYPSLTLRGSWGWKAFSTTALGGGNAVVGSLVGSLAMNLFDGGRLRARIALQDAMREQAVIAWESSILTALEDVENALVAYARGRERLDTRRRAAVAARNAAQLARTMFEAGAVDFQQVLDTQRTRLTVEESRVIAEGELLTAVVRLYKAMGGGWQVDTSTQDGNS